MCAQAPGKLGVDATRSRQKALLERASRDDDPDVRSQAIRALSMVDRPTTSIRHAVLAGLEDADAEVRTAAVEALCQWGPLDETPLALLLTLLEDANEDVRVQVIKALPQLARATPAVIEGLSSRLQDDTDLVQAHAAQALGELGSDAAAAGEVLLRAAQTGEVNVRERAIEAIELIRPAQSLVEIDAGETAPAFVIDALHEIEAQHTNEYPSRSGRNRSYHRGQRYRSRTI